MRAKHLAVALLAALLAAGGGLLAVLADDDHHHGKDRHGEGHERNGNGEGREQGLGAATDPAYQEACGACHFAYPPGLLPAASWRGLLAGLDDHFGNPVDLDPAARQAVAACLEAGAADRTGSKLARKVLRGLGRETPLRITDLPGFQREHHEISAEVLARPSIGSLANCPACHATAAAGDFDDDNASIPRQ